MVSACAERLLPQEAHIVPVCLALEKGRVAKILASLARVGAPVKEQKSLNYYHLNYVMRLTMRGSTRMQPTRLTLAQ